MNAMAYTTPVWWGKTALAPEQSQGWHLGGLDLLATRTTREWCFQLNRRPLQNEEEQLWSALQGPLPDSAPSSRFFFNQTAEALLLLPRLADRSVVVKPVHPLFVASGQQVTLYVSTPIWLACYVENQEEPLLDVPVIRPADTWFGRSTIQGAMCYATKVLGRTDLQHFPPRPFRAITPVTLCNNDSSVLPIERINIPVPYLPLYAAENGRLWTPSLHVLKEPGAHAPRIRSEPSISPLAGTVTRLTPARLGGSENTLMRIFDNFF